MINLKRHLSKIAFLGGGIAALLDQHESVSVRIIRVDEKLITCDKMSPARNFRDNR